MPNYQAHAVYNLDETVAVGDNPYFNTAIEESAFKLYLEKETPFSQLKENEIFIHEGNNKTAVFNIIQVL